MTYNQYKKDSQQLSRDLTEIDLNIPSMRVSGVRYADVRFDADDSAPDYIGLAAEAIATSDDGWIVYKFTYSGANVTRIQKTKGAWDDRLSLF